MKFYIFLLCIYVVWVAFFMLLLAAILMHPIRYYLVTENYEGMIKDEQKINWFAFINFQATPQDAKHIQELDTAMLVSLTTSAKNNV